MDTETRRKLIIEHRKERIKKTGINPCTLPLRSSGPVEDFVLPRGKALLIHIDSQTAAVLRGIYEEAV